MSLTEQVGSGTGLRLSFDSRNDEYPVAAMLDPVTAPVSRKWPLTHGRIFQGNEPKCVGGSIGQELGAEPVPVPISRPWTMDNIYNRAQLLDEWPGEGYAGTSLNAGLKAAKSWGYITEWRWAASVEEVLAALSQLGPVLMAGPWLTGMFAPDAEGRVRVNGTAGDIGHAYMLGELDAPAADTFIEQTWGQSWSRLGLQTGNPDDGWRAKLNAEDIRTLMRMGTQAAIITGRGNPDAPSPPALTPNRVTVRTLPDLRGQDVWTGNGSLGRVDLGFPDGTEKVLWQP